MLATGLVAILLGFSRFGNSDDFTTEVTEDTEEEELDNHRDTEACK